MNQWFTSTIYTGKQQDFQLLWLISNTVGDWAPDSLTTKGSKAHISVYAREKLFQVIRAKEVCSGICCRCFHSIVFLLICYHESVLSCHWTGWPIKNVSGHTAVCCDIQSALLRQIDLEKGICLSGKVKITRQKRNSWQVLKTKGRLSSDTFLV